MLLFCMEADLAAISAYSNVKHHIQTYVNAGYTAMIPQRGITVGSWSGQGWIVTNEATGAAGYMICGGLNNETTLINGGSGTTIINNPISTFVAFLYKLVPGGSSLTIGFTLWYAAATLALPFYCWAATVLFGYAFILLGIALIIGSFFVPPLSIRVRRREYAYA